MTTIDYDAPRRCVVEREDDSVEELQARRVSARSPVVDLDAPDAVEGFELPGAELAGEAPTMTVVVPVRADEFRCSRCFLYVTAVCGSAGLRICGPAGQRVCGREGRDVCRECA